MFLSFNLIICHSIQCNIVSSHLIFFIFFNSPWIHDIGTPHQGTFFGENTLLEEESVKFTLLASVDTACFTLTRWGVYHHYYFLCSFLSFCVSSFLSSCSLFIAVYLFLSIFFSFFFSSFISFCLSLCLFKSALIIFHHLFLLIEKSCSVKVS